MQAHVTARCREIPYFIASSFTLTGFALFSVMFNVKPLTGAEKHKKTCIFDGKVLLSRKLLLTVATTEKTFVPFSVVLISKCRLPACYTIKYNVVNIFHLFFSNKYTL